jgi:hypothetical protein
VVYVLYYYTIECSQPTERAGSIYRRWDSKFVPSVPPLSHRSRTKQMRFCRLCVRDGANYLAPSRAACDACFCIQPIYIRTWGCVPMMHNNKRPVVTCNFASNFNNFMVGFLHRLCKVAADLKCEEILTNAAPQHSITMSSRRSRSRSSGRRHRIGESTYSLRGNQIATVAPRFFWSFIPQLVESLCNETS